MSIMITQVPAYKYLSILLREYQTYTDEETIKRTAQQLKHFKKHLLNPLSSSCKL